MFCGNRLIHACRATWPREGQAGRVAMSSAPQLCPNYRRAVDPDEFLAEMFGIVERAFQGSGYPAAVRAVYRRLPNMPPHEPVPFADWLISKMV